MAEPAKAAPPQSDCVKCGQTKAFLYSNPRYVFAGYSEWLEWVCINCGYRVTTKPLDTK